MTQKHYIRWQSRDNYDSTVALNGYTLIRCIYHINTQDLESPHEDKPAQAFESVEESREWNVETYI